MGDYNTPSFWRTLRINLSRGDVMVCVANSHVPDGFHSQCSYALLDVIEIATNTTNPEDIIIKLHNCYHDAPTYTGPLRHGDTK